MALQVFLRHVSLKYSSRTLCLISTRCEYSTGMYSHPGQEKPDKDIIKDDKKPVEKQVYPGEFEPDRPKGKIADKKPFRMTLVAGKRYAWCTCGYSKNQPLCDGFHKKAEYTTPKKFAPKFRPLRFQVEEEKDYWLCNCKQTENPPFCDGTHKRDDIQEKIKS